MDFTILKVSRYVGTLFDVITYDNKINGRNSNKNNQDSIIPPDLIELAALAVSVEETEELLKRERDLYNRNIEFLDADGNLHTIDLNTPVDYEALNRIENDADINEYWLYTRENPDSAQVIKINDARSIVNSNFNPQKETVFIVHGWQNTGGTEPNLTVRRAFLAKSDVNVITVDWQRVSVAAYVSAVLGVPSVGRGIGRFINYLVDQFKVSYDNIHLVGFSLGAHVVGIAGRETGGRVARITGLDPAGPLWNTNKNRLTATDGVFVEAIHTDGGLTVGGLGIGSDCAQVDFYPNGGVSQPGCITNSCNHGRSWEYFAASITYNHLVGKRCRNSLQIALNTCRGEELAMGNDLLRKNATSGSYRVNTGRRYPF